MINRSVILAVFWRDLRGYFTTPTGYVFISLFIVASACLLFVWNDRFFAENMANLNLLNEYMPYLLLLFVPAVTMNIWADERRQGTDALLLTLPATDADIVIGKYLAVVSIFTVSLVFSLSNLWFLSWLGKPDMGLMFGTYLGYWLMGVGMLAPGMVGSMLSRNATIGFVLGVALCGLTIAPEMLGWLSTLTKSVFFENVVQDSGEVVVTVAAAPLLILFAMVAVALSMRSLMRSWLVPGMGITIAILIALLIWLPQWLWDAARDFGVVQRFSRIGAGEAVLGDLLYFLALAGAFLFINIIVLGRRHWSGAKESRFLWVHALLRGSAATVAAISTVVLLGYTEVRGDLTAEALHSLSPITRSTVDEIAKSDNKTVLIQAYVSPEVPREYVRTRLDLLAMLRRLEDLGRGRIRVNVHDTRTHTARAREAKDSFGIEPVQVLDLSEGRQSTESIFMGIAVTCGLEREVIKFLYVGNSVEYELTRTIRAVASASRLRVGILNVGIPFFGEYDSESGRETKDAQLVTELKKQYDVISIDADTDYPGTNVAKDTPADGSSDSSSESKPNEESSGKPLHALIVIQPSLLAQPQMDRLRDYIQAGNAVLIMQDPWVLASLQLSPYVFKLSEQQRARQQGNRGEQPPPRGNIKAFFESVGVSMNNDEALWVRHNPHPKLESLSREPEKVIFIHGSDKWRVFDQGHPITQGLQEVVMVTAGSISEGGGATSTLKLQPLMWTPPNNGRVTAEHMLQKQNTGGFMIPQGFYAKTNADQSVVAGRVTGKFENGKESRLAIVTDIDFILMPFVWDLRNQNIPDLKFDNVTFVLNAIDELAGEVGLLELRKRRPLHRTLSVIEAERSSFEKKLDEFTRDAEDAAEAEINRLRAKNQKQLSDIDQNEGHDAKSKEQIKSATSRQLEAQLQRSIAEINEEKDLKVSIERQKVEELISGIEDSYKVYAVVIPPIPALLLGIFVFVMRRRREYASLAVSRTL